MKTYVIIVSTTFPATHKRKGEKTNFVDKILISLNLPPWDYLPFPCYDPKLHTIRANYPIWKKRIDEVLAGNAVLSIRYHTLGRYVKGNKQIEFLRLDKDSGVGVQQLAWTIDNSADNRPILFESGKIINLNELAKNDGLSFEDFKDWFRKYDLSKPMGIIHFTPFRY
jgi:hypothetical protein